MRQVFYRVAASLDGYIAGPKGEIDWIVNDPSVDVAEVYAATDTVLLGRRTYELTLQPGAPPWPPGWKVHVFSRTLVAEEHPRVTISKNAELRVTALRGSAGKQIWLFGGGSLFRGLLEASQVDIVEVIVMPVLLGGGVPLVETGCRRTGLSLVESKAFPSGIVRLRYAVAGSPSQGSRISGQVSAM